MIAGVSRTYQSHSNIQHLKCIRLPPKNSGDTGGTCNIFFWETRQTLSNLGGNVYIMDFCLILSLFMFVYTCKLTALDSDTLAVIEIVVCYVIFSTTVLY